MNYFHRKAFAQLLERRELAYRLQQERQLEQEHSFGPTSAPNGDDLLSPGTTVIQASAVRS